MTSSEGEGPKEKTGDVVQTESSGEDDTPHTGHTNSPVPLIFMSNDDEGRKLREGGGLADLAPTVLQLLGLEQPAAMSGVSLLVEE